MLKEIKRYSGDNLRFPKDIAFEEDLKSILKQMLQYDPAMRATKNIFGNDQTAHIVNQEGNTQSPLPSKLNLKFCYVAFDG